MLVYQQDNARAHMAGTQLIDQLVIRSVRKNTNFGIIQTGHHSFPCLVGHGGIGQKSREGDRITPVGCWKMGYFLFRSDKIHKPHSFLPGFPITQQDSWCDLSPSRHYNQPLATILPGTSEALWRPDSLYDIIIVLDHNTQPSISGQGSAIFIHLRGTSNYTQGCIALQKTHMLRILEQCSSRTKVRIIS